MKKMILYALLGCAVGLAVNSLICLVSSYYLHLGYYAPCFVLLSEPCGGELNAALVQASAFGGLGIIAGIVIRVVANIRRKS